MIHYSGVSFLKLTEVDVMDLLFLFGGIIGAIAFAFIEGSGNEN